MLHRADYGWLKPFLVWLALEIRLVTWHVPAAPALLPAAAIWKHTAQRGVRCIPERARLPLGALGTVVVFCVGTFVPAEVDDNTRANRAVSCFGLIVFLFVFWLTSKNRKAINWQTVIVGMLAQFVIAVFVLKTGAGVSYSSFVTCDRMMRLLLGRSDELKLSWSFKYLKLSS